MTSADRERSPLQPVRERIERWTSGFESATGPGSQHSIVVYRDSTGERTLQARHTRDLRLQQVSA